MTETYTDGEQPFTYINAFHPCVGKIFGEVFWYGSWERAIHDIKQYIMDKYGYINIDLLEVKLNPLQWKDFNKEVQSNLKYFVNLEFEKKLNNNKC